MFLIEADISDVKVIYSHQMPWNMFLIEADISDVKVIYSRQIYLLINFCSYCTL